MARQTAAEKLEAARLACQSWQSPCFAWLAELASLADRQNAVLVAVALETILVQKKEGLQVAFQHIPAGKVDNSLVQEVGRRD
jgi:hypothetical protein